jgi:hypothetical protein
MLQQVTITTRYKSTLRPIVLSALEAEKRMVLLGLEQTRKRLAEFEQQYGITSAEFERRLNRGELDETISFTDWRMEIGMLRQLEWQYEALLDASVD